MDKESQTPETCECERQPERVREISAGQAQNRPADSLSREDGAERAAPRGRIESEIAGEFCVGQGIGRRDGEAVDEQCRDDKREAGGEKGGSEYAGRCREVDKRQQEDRPQSA